MPYYDSEAIERARQVDLLTYLQTCEPQELVHVSGNVYCTKTHDSLRISNGKWCWFSRGIGGYSALDYLIKVNGYSFMDAMETITGKTAIRPPSFVPAPKEEKPKHLLLPQAAPDNQAMVDYLKKRGIAPEVIDYCVQTGRLYESRNKGHSNVVFVGFDKEGKARFGCLRGIGEGRFHGDLCGSDKHYSFTPEYTNAWPAMFIQSALVYAYYLLPFSMIVVCVMIAGRETGNNGILKMLALPVSRCALSIAKFCVLTFYLFMEMVVFLVVFVIAGLIATQTMGVTETLPILYLLKWCLGLFLTMLPCIAAMWAITVLFEKPLLSVGLNLLLVIPGVLVANTPLWIAYPYCYSGYLVSCSLHDFTAETSDAAFSMFPFLPCAIVVFGLFFALAVTQFGKKEMR